MKAALFALSCLMLIACLEIEQPVHAYFCAAESCTEVFVQQIRNAKSEVKCAFYHLNDERLMAAITEKARDVSSRIIIDEDYIKDFDASFARARHSKGLMHDKFCVIDNQLVLTGSFNPVEGSDLRDANNVILMNSSGIARAYEKEFDELWSGTESAGGFKGSHVSAYFCPEDRCAEKVLTAIGEAKNSIYFMTYSFTDREIALALIMQKNLDVRGIIDGQQASSSVMGWLDFQGIDVIKDTNPGLMHHKVFIIDNETVITGSYNPTENGNRYNDENLVLIKDKRVAEAYLNEFERLWSRTDDNKR